MTKPPKPSQEDLFKSQTLTVSAETQRQWSMAKLPRTNEEDLLETYPPNRPHPQAGEDGAVENKVAPEHVGGAGESAPDDERRPGPDEPTWITERVQHQRARKRAVIVGAAALVVALGLIAFMLGGRSDDHSASAETERGGQPSLKAAATAPAASEAPHEATALPKAPLSNPEKPEALAPRNVEPRSPALAQSANPLERSTGTAIDARRPGTVTAPATSARAQAEPTRPAPVPGAPARPVPSSAPNAAPKVLPNSAPNATEKPEQPSWFRLEQ